MEQRPLARTEGLVAERFDEELVIYDQLSHTGHSLPSDAASVWEHCDGRHSSAQLARQLGLAHDVVTRSLLELQTCGLLDQPVPPRSRIYSRREAAVRVAKIGVVAISAPLIYSVAIAPATAAASTCVPVSDSMGSRWARDQTFKLSRVVISSRSPALW
jgi:hypothetical protein